MFGAINKLSLHYVVSSVCKRIVECHREKRGVCVILLSRVKFAVHLYVDIGKLLRINVEYRPSAICHPDPS